MLRRVARALRVGLFVLGLVLVGGFPVSWLYRVTVVSPWPGKVCILKSVAGAIRVSIVIQWDIYDWETDKPFEHGLYLSTYGGFETPRPWFPFFREGTGVGTNYRMIYISLPHWLLAFICLAWPVMSFIISRRRHKRGFPVELAPSSGVGSGPPLPPGEGGWGGREATG